jgi:hypothetical protein
VKRAQAELDWIGVRCVAGFAAAPMTQVPQLCGPFGPPGRPITMRDEQGRRADDEAGKLRGVSGGGLHRRTSCSGSGEGIILSRSG